LCFTSSDGVAVSAIAAGGAVIVAEVGMGIIPSLLLLLKSAAAAAAGVLDDGLDIRHPNFGRYTLCCQDAMVPVLGR
jgi:hypothetical protein